jgi:hypothetical protein
MAVRKTERRLPVGFDATDLGEAVVSSDNKLALVSYYSSPITLTREQTYVAFVLDSALQGSVAHYQWQIGVLDTQTTTGVWTHSPDDVGTMELTLTLRDGGGASLKSVTLSQTVVPPNQELENLIQLDVVRPSADDPATSREVINDLLLYFHQLAPLASAEHLNRLLFGISYVECQDHPKSDRETLLAHLADQINGDNALAFFQQANAGAGVCRIRPPLLAMVYSPGGSALLPWAELPQDEAARNAAITAQQTTLSELAEEKHVDIFNLLRFPKANLTLCKQICDALRTHYFAGASYSTILVDATRAGQLIDEFKTGPYALETP